MSAIRMIAWGTIDVSDPDNSALHKQMRKAVRSEMREHGMRLVANGNKRFRLVLKNKVSTGHKRRDRRKAVKTVYIGPFKGCCEAATKIIEMRLEGQ